MAKGTILEADAVFEAGSQVFVEELGVALERRQDHPQDREQEEDQGRQQDQTGDEPPNRGAAPHATAPPRTRFW